MNRVSAPTSAVAAARIARLACAWTLLGCAGVLPACASVPSAREVARMGVHALVGTWTSELDETTLTVREDGTFIVERPARGTRPAASASGRWLPSGESVVLRNDASAAVCTDVEGTYTPEIVRDTVRFTLVSDDCPPREEHMAWPWRRGSAAVR
jgi:hypothetical protein